jgi:hypothetical protein
MLENNLYQSLKKRMMDEVNDSLQRHPVYRQDVKAYGKYHMGKERPQVGVSLFNANGSRITLSPDDTIGDMWAMVVMTKVGTHPGTSIEWAWEDVYNIAKKVTKEDVTATLSADRVAVNVSHTPLTQGPQNPNLLNNIGQISLFINGVQTFARSANALTGEILMQESAPAGAKIKVSYYYKDMDLPGFYYIEMMAEDSFIITPMHTEDGEVVITKTTGTEVGAQLLKTPVLTDYVLSLYLQSSAASPRIFLDRGVDYTILSSGEITFLTPLPSKYTLYASYRWQGVTRGPFEVKTEYSYNATAIKGVVLAFGSRRLAGDKMCVVLTSTRERCAHVKGGHYLMTLEWKIFSRDPMTTSEISDHLAADIWGFRKEPLRSEGITLQQCFPTGESESAYDEATQTMYFENTLSMEIMTEWKRFIPYIIKIRQHKDAVQMHAPYGSVEQSFTVQYPVTGYPTFL